MRLILLTVLCLGLLLAYVECGQTTKGGFIYEDSICREAETDGECNFCCVRAGYSEGAMGTLGKQNQCVCKKAVSSTTWMGKHGENQGQGSGDGEGKGKGKGQGKGEKGGKSEEEANKGATVEAQ